jgi:hypothetical protein
VYSDTISDLDFAEELANYGEYSGAPSTEHTFIIVYNNLLIYCVALLSLCIL